MNLRVPYEEFPDAVRRLLAEPSAYVSTLAGGSLLSAADPGKQLLITAISQKPADEARSDMEQQGLPVYSGSWSSGEGLEGGSLQTHIAAVSYASSGATPGLWVDAFPHLPAQTDVLRAMYDEMLATGEMREVTFDEFIRLSKPNVLILSPEEIAGFASTKLEC
jgi:hypothetical protein